MAGAEQLRRQPVRGRSFAARPATGRIGGEHDVSEQVVIGWSGVHCLVARFLVLTALVYGISPAQADTFGARYEARLSDISIGSGQLTGELKAGAYTATLRGDVSLLGVSTRFVASSKGLSRDAKIVPARYQLRTEGATERAVTVDFLPDRTATVSIEPPPTESEQRGLIPLEEAHRRNALDPISAVISELLRLSQSDNPCTGVAQVFTGSSRFNVDIVAGGTRNDEIECRAVHRPIAGHRPTGNGRPTIAVVTFPKTRQENGIRLPTRIEVPLSLGTVTIRRVT